MIGLTPDMIAAAAVRHGVLRLTFADGLSGEVEVLERMRGPVSEHARTPDGFAQVAVDLETGTVVWPSGADLAPDTLYERARTGAWPEQDLRLDAAHPRGQDETVGGSVQASDRSTAPFRAKRERRGDRSPLSELVRSESPWCAHADACKARGSRCGVLREPIPEAGLIGIDSGSPRRGVGSAGAGARRAPLRARR